MAEINEQELNRLYAQLAENPNDREVLEKIFDNMLPELKIPVISVGIRMLCTQLLEEGVHPESLIVALATVFMKLYQERYSEELTDKLILYWIGNISHFSQTALTFVSEKMQDILERIPADEYISEVPEEFFGYAKDWNKRCKKAEKKSKKYGKDAKAKIHMTSVSLKVFYQFMENTAKLEEPIEKEVYVNVFLNVWLQLMVMGYAKDPQLCFYFAKYWQKLYPFMINDYMQSLWRDVTPE